MVAKESAQKPTPDAQLLIALQDCARRQEYLVSLPMLRKKKAQNPETSVSFSLPLESEKWQLPGRTVLTVELIADRSAYPR